MYSQGFYCSCPFFLQGHGAPAHFLLDMVVGNLVGFIHAARILKWKIQRNEALDKSYSWKDYGILTGKIYKLKKILQKVLYSLQVIFFPTISFEGSRMKVQDYSLNFCLEVRSSATHLSPLPLPFLFLLFVVPRCNSHMLKKVIDKQFRGANLVCYLSLHF